MLTADHVGVPTHVQITYTRFYSEPTAEEADAGFGGGWSDERTVQAENLTLALRELLSDEAVNDAQDAETLEAFREAEAARERVKLEHTGRPVAK